MGKLGGLMSTAGARYSIGVDTVLAAFKTPATAMCIRTLVGSGAIMRPELDIQPEADTLNTATHNDPVIFWQLHTGKLCFEQEVEVEVETPAAEEATLNIPGEQSPTEQPASHEPSSSGLLTTQVALSASEELNTQCKGSIAMEH